MNLFLPDNNTGILPISYFHALARLGEEGLILIEPAQPFVSLGYFDSKDIVDCAYCATHDIPVMRRETGGGMVLLAPGQVFYTLVVKRPHACIPSVVNDAYQYLSQAPMAVYRDFGIATTLRPVNDIVTESGRKIGGQGAADINGHFCFVGSILVDFDCDLMHHLVRLPHPHLKPSLKAALHASMSSITQETGTRPSAKEIKDRLIDAFSPLVDGLQEVALPSSLSATVHAVSRELTESVDNDEEPRLKPLFKVQEGLYLCQRVIETGFGAIAISLSIADGVITDAEIMRTNGRHPVPSMREWVGRRFTLDELPVAGMAEHLGIATEALVTALFGF